ncbi:uncharacterized protein LOC128185379 [Crassostrea angulata]|uniref:uncharacterized protein LOC128185379 n=1 Tax=Magallana angulata TaxID=2784310 RepID=UPI0022B15951|nr:uncharacterized protein LOC128185379 [Crassostrea angulata]
MQFICYLFNTELNETSVKPDVGFAIMHNISQDKEIMGHCLNHACKIREQCISLRNSSACLRSGCRHRHYLLDDKKRICYRIVDTVNLTWSNAEKYCKNDGGHLITLDVEDKNGFISNALQSCLT